MPRLANKVLQKDPTAVAVSSGSITINPKLSRYFVVDVDANVTSVAINAPPGACGFTILLQFAGTYSVEGFPSTVKWIGTNMPPFSGDSGEEAFIAVEYFDSSDGYRADSGGIYTPTAET